ncbi:unnamed protein product [Caenorhabditis brenneri]
MLPHGLNAIFFLLIFICCADALRCFQSHTHHHDTTIVDGMDFCLAFFEEGTQGFSAGSDKKRVLRGFKYDVSNNHECQLQRHRLIGEEVKVYVCICFHNLCNEPLKWYQFKRQHYSLTKSEITKTQ